MSTFGAFSFIKSAPFMKVIRNTDKWNFKFHAFCASALSEVTVAVLTAFIHPKVMVLFASVLMRN